MPVPIAAAALGVEAAQSIINPILQSVQNRQNRKFAEKMYGRQRQDALDDWQRQNEYNSPEAQMARFKAAGLNPNLIYGQTNEGATVRSTSAAVPEGEAPQIRADLSRYADIRQTQAQTDLSVKALETQDLNQELLRAQIMKTIADTSTTQYNLGYKQSMQEMYSEITAKKLEQLQVSNARQWQALGQSEQEFPIKIANMLLQGSKLQQDIKTAPFIRKQIAQQISSSLSSQQLTELKSISESQQQSLFSEIHQSKIWQNKLDGKRITLYEQQQELNRLKIATRGMGISENALENIIKTIIGIRISR